MPRKRTYRRRKRPVFKRKRFYRRRAVGRMAGSRNLFGLPQMRKVSMRYAEHGLTLNPGVASLGYTIFSCNNIYDPNYSGTGHQPISYDQWGTLYNHYQVIGSRIRVICANRDTAERIVCGITTQATYTPTPTTLQYQLEQPHTTWKTLGTASSGKSSCVLTSKWSMRRFFPDYKTHAGLTATFGNNPSEQTYWVIWAGSADGTSDPTGHTDATVIIDYIVMLSEPKNLAAS